MYAPKVGIAHSASGATVYAIFRLLNDVGKVYRLSNDTFETYASANFSTYVVNCAEEGTSQYYSVLPPMGGTTWGSDVTVSYEIEANFYVQVGGSKAESDTLIGRQRITMNHSGDMLNQFDANEMKVYLRAGSVDGISFPGHKKLLMILSGLQKWFRR